MDNIKLQKIITSINERLNLLDKRVDENEIVLRRVIHEFNDLFKVFIMMDETENFGDIGSFKLCEKSEKNLINPVYIKDGIMSTKFLSEQVEQLKEFEKELENYKDELTPGTMGES